MTDTQGTKQFSPIPSVERMADTTLAVATAVPDGATAVGVPVAGGGDPPAQLGVSRERLAAAGFDAGLGATLSLPTPDEAIVVAVGIMMAFAGPVGDFVTRNPTVKMLALAFLFLIGTVLVADGWGQHIEKGYIYFAMGFAIVVEMLNLRLRRRSSGQGGA